MQQNKRLDPNVSWLNYFRYNQSEIQAFPHSGVVDVIDNEPPLFLVDS